MDCGTGGECNAGTCECAVGYEIDTDGACADVDECLTDNGGCGDAMYFSCTNNEGSAAACDDIDECLTDNGGCGDAMYFSCTNNEGSAAACDDIDECLTDNGGCGENTTCANQSGAAPLCVCDPGYIESGAGCEACSACNADQFTTATCSGTVDTACAACQEPPSGSWVVSACVAGAWDTLGTNTQSSTCSPADPGSYISSVCVPGSSTTLGSDTASTTCGEPGSTSYVTAACVAGAWDSLGTNTLSSACSPADPGSYVIDLCVPGSSTTIGSDAVITGCSAIPNCDSGLTCTNSTDSICATCTLGYSLFPDSTACVHGMFIVDAGNFWMGCNSAVDSNCESGEFPYHQVYLDAYLIDEYQVTAAAYKDCVNAGVCVYNGSTTDPTRTYNNGQDDHPINYVNWSEAKTYCEWKGKRLLTEAEWEKAARGGCEFYSDCELESHKYPWGNEVASCDYVVMDDGTGGCGTQQTWPVGSKPFGASVYGPQDMAGNVWEWTADWSSPSYYSESPSSNPTGPDSGSWRVLRGGSYLNTGDFFRSSARGFQFPGYRYSLYGFRCAL
jgi:formylglycine-generating enzyme required for sulfatase activity